MKAAKAWCLSTVVLMVGISLSSCGKDDGLGGGGGTVLGGSGGSGGGSAGSSGQGRAGSSGVGVSVATKLGQACVNDTQCDDPSAPGLTCITATDTKTLGGKAPPKGICSAPCSAAGQECEALGTGALCYPFDETSSTGYCIEGCTFGEPDVGEPDKCHNRPEFGCYPALAAPTDDPCESDDDCVGDEFCSQRGVCASVVPGCLPSCRGDIDCAEGLYCDQSLLQGTCVAEKPTGKALGEPCTVSTTNPREPDECIGFCQADTTGSPTGHCANSCGLLRQCGYNSATEKFDGLCLYLSQYTAEAGQSGAGDFGFCALTCNCTDECMDPSLECTLSNGDELVDSFRGPGLCFPPSAGSIPYNQCSGSGGAGGAGGAGNAGAGAGGDGSDSAAGASNGGAPGTDGGANTGGAVTP